MRQGSGAEVLGNQPPQCEETCGVAGPHCAPCEEKDVGFGDDVER